MCVLQVCVQISNVCVWKTTFYKKNEKKYELTTLIVMIPSILVVEISLQLHQALKKEMYREKFKYIFFLVA
jgi:hypothetical protein